MYRYMSGLFYPLRREVNSRTLQFHWGIVWKIYKDILYTNYEWHVNKNPIKLMTLFTSNLSKLSRNIIRQIPLLVGYFSTLIIPIVSLIILSPKYSLILILLFYFIF